MAGLTILARGLSDSPLDKPAVQVDNERVFNCRYIRNGNRSDLESEGKSGKLPGPRVKLDTVLRYLNQIGVEAYVLK
jgi:hypothetical protein